MSDTTQNTTVPNKKKKNPGLIIIVVAFLAILAVNLTRGSEKVKWAESLEASEEAAKANGKPILMLFTTDAGKYANDCNRMGYATINKPDTAKYINKNYNPVMFDFDENKSIASKYKVKELPAIVIKLYDKEDYRRLDGFISNKEFGSRTSNATKELD